MVLNLCHGGRTGLSCAATPFYLAPPFLHKRSKKLKLFQDTLYCNKTVLLEIRWLPHKSFAAKINPFSKSTNHLFHLIFLQQSAHSITIILNIHNKFLQAHDFWPSIYRCCLVDHGHVA